MATFVVYWHGKQPLMAGEVMHFVPAVHTAEPGLIVLKSIQLQVGSCAETSGIRATTRLNRAATRTGRRAAMATTTAWDGADATDAPVMVCRWHARGACETVRPSAKRASRRCGTAAAARDLRPQHATGSCMLPPPPGQPWQCARRAERRRAAPRHAHAAPGYARRRPNSAQRSHSTAGPTRALMTSAGGGAAAARAHTKERARKWARGTCAAPRC